MRALSGAIITAAALLGLGLTAQGIGTRYASAPVAYVYEQPEKQKSDGDGRADGRPQGHVRVRDMDSPLLFTLVYLTAMSLVGLGMTFLGIIYHHMRRERDFQWEKERHLGQQRTAV